MKQSVRAAWLGAACALLACGTAGALGVGCGNGDKETDEGSGGSGATDAGGDATAGGGDATDDTAEADAVAMCTDEVPGAEVELADTSDPEAGEFTMEEALAGLPEGPGPLRAIITTDLGVVTCELFPEEAPYGVANFVGLARGTRAFRKSGIWMKGPFYDGLTFHRIIDDFMAQGGDPLGTGTGGPGYKFLGEVPPTLTHTPSALAYANSGTDANGDFFNGSQFYITEVATTWLDGSYTVFGKCGPIEVIQAITAIETDCTVAGADPTTCKDKPTTPFLMQTVRITRCASTDGGV